MTSLGALMRIARLLIIACSLAIFTTGVAHAEDTENEAGSFFSSLSNLGTAVSKRLNEDMGNAMFSEGMRIAGSTTSFALVIGGSLALIYLIVGAIKSLGGKGDPIVVVLFDIGLPAVFAAALIHGYGDRMLEFKAFLSKIEHISGARIDNLFSFFGSLLGMIVDSLKEALSNLFKIQSWTKIIASAIDFLASLAFIIPILMLIITGVAEVAGLLLLGPFLMAVGAAFGPIAIATLVTPWTNDYFGKWLGFMVGAAFVTAVAGVVAAIASAVFGGLFSSPSLSSGDAVAIRLATAGILVIVLNSMLAQVPSIASALVPGSIGVKGGQGSAIRSAGADVGNRAANKAKGLAQGTASLTKAAKGKLDAYKSASKSVTTPDVGSKISFPTLNS